MPMCFIDRKASASADDCFCNNKKNEANVRVHEEHRRPKPGLANQSQSIFDVRPKHKRKKKSKADKPIQKIVFDVLEMLKRSRNRCFMLRMCVCV